MIPYKNGLSKAIIKFMFPIIVMIRSLIKSIVTMALIKVDDSWPL